MTETLTPLSPRDVADRLAAGLAVLVDIREPDEFARKHVKGALSRPLSVPSAPPLPVAPGQAVIFTCMSGMRTHANAVKLARQVEGDAFVVQGGLNARVEAGLPVESGA
jgi:rhodanese-related sulfurtransferase